MSNPWDAPPRSPRGDQNENDLFAQIGRALTAWEGVESQCALLFALFLSVSHKVTYRAPALRAYGTVISFPGRCEMIKAAASAYFQRRSSKAKLAKRLDEVIGIALQFSARRNEIAHGQVRRIVQQLPNRKRDDIGFYLVPSFFNPRKIKIEGKPAYEYASRDIIHFRQEFTKLEIMIDFLRRQFSNASPKAQPSGEPRQTRA